MNLTDSLADMFNRIRNANMARADFTVIPYSNMKTAVSSVLKKEGFISDFMAEGSGPGKILKLYLKYAGGRRKEPVIRGLKRVSTPGSRKYAKKDAIPVVMKGTGMVILSTSKGVMSGREAEALGVGGEVLGKVW